MLFNLQQVVYAGVKEDDEGLAHLMSLSKVVRGRCLSNGITLVDADRFTPHMTLLKLSKDPQLRRQVCVVLFIMQRERKQVSLCVVIVKTCVAYISIQGIKGIERELFESHTQTTFGAQVKVMLRIFVLVNANF